MAEKKAKPKKKKMGRPSIYSDELAKEIVVRMADGESLKSICSDKHMPNRSTVHAWLLDGKHENFSNKYKEASNVRSEHMFDDLLDIAKSENFDSQRARLIVDTHKWYLSKVMPKKYGDKIDVTTDGKALPTPILGVQRDNSDKEDSSA